MINYEAAGMTQEQPARQPTDQLTLNQQPKKRPVPKPMQPVPAQPAAPAAGQTAPQPSMTFAQMQQQGFARPAPPPPVPTPTPQYGGGAVGGGGTYSGGGGSTTGGGGTSTGSTSPTQVRGDAQVQGATRQMLLQQLANPAGFGSAEVEQWYTRGAQDIDDQFSQSNTALREEMARRGLSDSSILGGRMADLNVAKRSAQTDLRDRLGRQLAEETSAARSRAIGQGMDFDKYMSESQFRGDELGLERDRLGLDRDLGFGKLGVEQGRLNLDADLGFGDLDLAQRKFGEDQYQFDADLEQRGSEFDREFGLDERRFGEDTRRYDQDFGEDVRRYDQDFGLEKDRFAWDQDTDLMDYFNNTEFLNPDTTPFYDEDEEDLGWM